MDLKNIVEWKKQGMEGYEKNNIYISFKVWKAIINSVYAYIFFLGIHANMPGNDKQWVCDDASLGRKERAWKWEERAQK